MCCMHIICVSCVEFNVFWEFAINKLNRTRDITNLSGTPARTARQVYVASLYLQEA